MLGNNEHTRFYVSNYGVSGETSTAFYNTNAKTIADLTVGQVALLTTDNRVMDGTTTDTLDGLVMKPSAKRYFRIGVKETSDSPVRLTDVIDYTTIKSKVKSIAATPVEKVAYIGYQGTGSATIETPAGVADYAVRMILRSELKMNGDYPLMKTFAYRTLSTDTAKELTHGIYKSIVFNLQREQEVETFVRVEVVSNGTQTTSGGTAASVAFGSRYVTFSANTTVATGAVLGIAGATYFVEEGVTAGKVIKLSTPYQGKNATITPGGTYATQIGTLATITLWGIRFVGVPRKFSEYKKFKYQKADWEIQLAGYNSSWTITTYAVTKDWNKGVGTKEAMLQLEYDLWQNEILAGNITIPTFIPKKNVVNGTLQYWASQAGVIEDVNGTVTVSPYDVVSIIWYNVDHKSFVQAGVPAPKEVILATGSYSTTATDLLAAIV